MVEITGPHSPRRNGARPCDPECAASGCWCVGTVSEDLAGFGVVRGPALSRGLQKCELAPNGSKTDPVVMLVVGVEGWIVWQWWSSCVVAIDQPVPRHLRWYVGWRVVSLVSLLKRKLECVPTLLVRLFSALALLVCRHKSCFCKGEMVGT